VECLPHEDLLPGLLIVGVVNADDVCHVLLPNLILTPTPAWGHIKHVSIKRRDDQRQNVADKADWVEFKGTMTK